MEYILPGFGHIRSVPLGCRGKVFDVNCHEFCVWCGENAVDENFDGGEVGGWGADVAFVDDSVASHGEWNAFGFGFFVGVGQRRCEGKWRFGRTVCRCV